MNRKNQHNRLAIALLAACLGVLIGCTKTPDVPAPAYYVERANWWADEVERLSGDEPTLETLSDVIQQLGAVEGIETKRGDNHYRAKLEEFDAEKYPCPYDSLWIVVTPDPTNVESIATYSIVSRSVCIATDSEYAADNDS